MHASSAREVWFIRHAESVANAGGRTREAPTYPLSDLGFRQAQQLAQSLPVEPELIVTSPYLRARQTAEPAIARFHRARVEEWAVQEVQYLDPALCVDTTQDERRVMSHEYWLRCDPHHAAPGAESFVDFTSRVQDAITRARQREERRIFVFCHGQFMQALAWLTLSQPAMVDSAAMRRFHSFARGVIVPNCSVLTMCLAREKMEALAGVWVPDGVEPVPACRNEPAEAGV